MPRKLGFNLSRRLAVAMSHGHDGYAACPDHRQSQPSESSDADRQIQGFDLEFCGAIL